MAEEVVSGGQQIASEATLAALLNAVSSSGDSNAAMKIKQLAGASGTSSDKLTQLGTAATRATQASLGLLGAFVNGTATTSQVFGAFGSLPGPVGAFAKGMSVLIGMQEQAMVQYQTLSNAGVHLGGSLTDLRMSAAQTHMTMQQFATFMKSNAAGLARLGGTVNDGAKAFVQMSNQMLTDGTGVKLKALGYTTEEVNQGMMDYIQMTGGRSAAELKNTDKIIASSAEYMTQLDGLAQLTGKSRQEQEKAMKEANQNAAIQQKLAGMDEKQKAAYNRGLAEMQAKFGKAGVELYQAQMLGIAPQTEAAQRLQALAPEVASASQGMADVAKRGGTMSETMQQSARATEAAVNASRKYGDALKGAASFKTDGTSQAINALGMAAVQAEKQGRTSSAAELAQREQIAKEQAERQESQAAVMAQADTNLKNFSAALMSVVNPFLQVATVLLNHFKWIAGAVGAYYAIQLLLNKEKVKEAAVGALQKFKNPFGGAGPAGALGGIAGRAPPAPPGTGGLAGAAPAGGGGFVTFIKALGRGLASLAPIAVPMLIGAGAVAGVIAILGAGLAVAIALIGLSLPTFAKGLKSITEIDGLNLAKVAFGIAALGPALVIFTGGSLIAGLGAVGSRILNFFSGGGPIAQIKEAVTELSPVLPQMEKIGPALNNYASGIVAFGKAVSGVDLAKAEKLKEVMKGPGVLEGIGTAIRDVGAATSKLITSNSGGQEKSTLELTTLNNTIKELIKVSKEISENTKRTYEATKNMSGDHFA